MAVLVTGIKPTGDPHLGNLVGMLRPTLAEAEAHEAYVFVADLHALNAHPDPRQLQRRTRTLAALLIALGLPERGAALYRQSDVPEISELTVLLANATALGLLRRAHAYKAAVAANQAAGRDDDEGVNAGLFNYPLLMAADVLAFGAQLVPVGRDQRQHLEIARDVAVALNARSRGVLPLPEALIEDVPTVSGLDGRKMSKSYGNVLPLLAPPDELRRLVKRIRTDSRRPEEPKDPDADPLYALVRVLASPAESEELARRYRQGGVGYAEVKERLFELLEAELGPLRERTLALLDDPAAIDDVLAGGARRARLRAAPYVARVREALGLGLAA
jgi:tryptophanyl-tRNA synthetase